MNKVNEIVWTVESSIERMIDGLIDEMNENGFTQEQKLEAWKKIDGELKDLADSKIDVFELCKV